MGSLTYLASNTKKVVPRTREIAMGNSTKGEVHGISYGEQETYNN